MVRPAAAGALLSLAFGWTGCGGTAATGNVPDGGAPDAAASGASDVPVPDDDAGAPDGAAGPFNVLLFSRTAAFRHDSIPAAIAALTELGATGGYVADATEDPTRFSAAGLARYRVVVFLITTGDVLDDGQQAAFEAWMNAGGSFVGVHSASDTEYTWPFYGQLVGAYFKQHPAVQPASVRVEVTTHPATIGLPPVWMRTDEWYDFQSNPRANVTVLANVDESTYTGGTMGADHPVAWAHTTTGGGRAFYTALGHPASAYAEPLFRQHLVGAIRWAAGR